MRNAQTKQACKQRPQMPHVRSVSGERAEKKPKIKSPHKKKNYAEEQRDFVPGIAPVKSAKLVLGSASRKH